MRLLLKALSSILELLASVSIVFVPFYPSFSFLPFLFAVPAFVIIYYLPLDVKERERFLLEFDKVAIKEYHTPVFFFFFYLLSHDKIFGTWALYYMILAFVKVFFLYLKARSFA